MQRVQLEDKQMTVGWPGFYKRISATWGHLYETVTVRHCLKTSRAINHLYFPETSPNNSLIGVSHSSQQKMTYITGLINNGSKKIKKNP